MPQDKGDFSNYDLSLLTLDRAVSEQAGTPICLPRGPVPEEKRAKGWSGRIKGEGEGERGVNKNKSCSRRGWMQKKLTKLSQQEEEEQQQQLVVFHDPPPLSPSRLPRLPRPGGRVRSRVSLGRPGRLLLHLRRRPQLLPEVQGGRKGVQGQHREAEPEVRGEGRPRSGRVATKNATSCCRSPFS